MHVSAKVLPVLLVLAAISACEKREKPTESTPGTTDRRVVLYTTADTPALRDIITAFEKSTKIDVLEVTGDDLPRRLASEHAAPRADVWWSESALTTANLASAGLFEPYSSASAEASIIGGWPTSLRAADASWYALALRARVIAYDPRKIEAAAAPRTLRDLAEPAWQGVVGMARPNSGAALGHIAALITLWGEEPTRQWLTAMEEQGLRLYDSDDSLLRALAAGEIAIALTNSDDALAAIADDLPVAFVHETDEAPGSPATPSGVEPMASFGALVIPGAAALVRAGPNPNEARQLLDFLLSETAERTLMAADARRVPVRESPARELFALHPEARIHPAAHVNLEEVAAATEAARRLVEGVFGG